VGGPGGRRQRLLRQAQPGRPPRAGQGGRGPGRNPLARPRRQGARGDVPAQVGLAHHPARLAGGREGRTPMSTAPPITTLQFYPKRSAILRYFALWYFTPLLVAWNILGHTVLGFEQSWLHPLVGLATALMLQFLLEWVDARVNGRRPRFLGSTENFVNFLPPAIIPGLACPMLLYPNESLYPVLFAAGLALCSRVLFLAPVGNGRTQHIFNPSNLGITATLLLFPWVGLAPPYHFTENLTGLWHWAMPAFVLVTGVIVHALFTGRLTLVVTWLV